MGNAAGQEALKQAMVIGGCVRRGEKGSLVVYANSITRTETDHDTNEETATQIHYMKGYTVFNVEQIDGTSSPPGTRFDPPSERIARFKSASGHRQSIRPYAVETQLLSRCLFHDNLGRNVSRALDRIAHSTTAFT